MRTSESRAKPASCLLFKYRRKTLLSLYPTMAEQKFEWMCWNNQQFIDLIRKHPCLWQVRNTNYKNKKVKSVSLNTLTKQLTSTINCVVTPDMIMKKLHTLSSCIYECGNILWQLRQDWCCDGSRCSVQDSIVLISTPFPNLLTKPSQRAAHKP